MASKKETKKKKSALEFILGHKKATRTDLIEVIIVVAFVAYIAFFALKIHEII